MSARWEAVKWESKVGVVARGNRAMQRLAGQGMASQVVI